MNTTDPTNPIQQAQCPHCQSTFSLSEKEMQLALGAVRCGECMKIFNARYHLVDAPPVVAAERFHARQSASLNFAGDTADLMDFNSNPSHSKQQPTGIPTLQEQPERVSLAKDFDVFDVLNDYPEDNTLEKDYLDKEYLDEYAEEENEAFGSKKITPSFIAGLLVLLSILALGGWLFSNQVPKVTYTFTEVRLIPSASPNKIDVYFKINNATNNSLPLPNLTIQLLNLSAQPVSSELVMAANLKPNLHEIQAATSHEMQASVERPAIFVQGAHIQVYLNDSKL